MVCRARRAALTIGFPLREFDYGSRGAAGALFAFARWCTSGNGACSLSLPPYSPLAHYALWQRSLRAGVSSTRRWMPYRSRSIERAIPDRTWLCASLW